MKAITLILLTLVFSVTSFAQVAINTDESSADNSAMLDVESTEMGFLPPRMNTDQRNAINSPAEGLCVYNTDSLCLEFWDGSSWFDICTGNSYTPPSPSSLPTGSGGFSGKMCFDISESNDDVNGCGTVASRIPLRADFNQSSTYSQSYTFTPDGTVSNVRFYHTNASGDVITAISGDNTANNINSPVTASVTYNQDLSSDDPDSPGNGLAYGLTSDNPLTDTIYVVYNDASDNTGTDRKLNITASVKDCDCCGLYVASGIWKEFMCHNLGANYSLDPFTPNWDINGAYWQWGRLGPADHRQTTNTSNFAARPTDGTSGGANDGIIFGWSTSYAAYGSWQDGIKTSNDPCPVGYRVPTNAQWSGAIGYNTWTKVGSWTAGSANYDSGETVVGKLFLPAAGERLNSNYAPQAGLLHSRNANGGYWSSTPVGTDYDDYVPCLYFDMLVVPVVGRLIMGTSGKRYGHSIRCIAE